jgi:uncharacterized protein YcaQ
MPLLQEDKLVARADVRRDPNTGALETGQLHAEPSADPMSVRETFNAAAGRLAAWLARRPR